MTMTQMLKFFLGTIVTVLCLVVRGENEVKNIPCRDNVEVVCWGNTSVVDVISFAKIDSNIRESEFMEKVSRVLEDIKGKGLRLSDTSCLYLGCKLPIEMKQTLYQVVSERYASSFAAHNYTISSYGSEYTNKLADRGAFHTFDVFLKSRGYKIDSISLEKVMILIEEKEAFAGTDITIKRCETSDPDIASAAVSGTVTATSIRLGHSSNEYVVTGCRYWEGKDNLKFSCRTNNLYRGMPTYLHPVCYADIEKLQKILLETDGWHNSTHANDPCSLSEFDFLMDNGRVATLRIPSFEHESAAHLVIFENGQSWLATEIKASEYPALKTLLGRLHGMMREGQQLWYRNMARPCRYRVGDANDGGTLSGISRMFYGNEGKWPDIWRANQAILRNPNRIRDGVVLTIP